MKSGSKQQPSAPAALFSDAERVDKSSYLPAYVQLSQILRRRISNETYPAGTRLPSETALAKSFGVSAVTARQAVGMLADEGLVKRVQGSGTFVTKLQLASSSFTLEALRDVLTDQDNLEVRILKATVEKPVEGPRKALQLAVRDRVVVVERLILHHRESFALQTGYARFDPESPDVETMLDTRTLSGLFFEESQSGFMKGELRLWPTTVNEREAGLMTMTPGGHAFKLEHTFYDFTGRPMAYGWFIVSPLKMPLIGRVGVWND